MSAPVFTRGQKLFAALIVLALAAMLAFAFVSSARAEIASSCHAAISSHKGGTTARVPASCADALNDGERQFFEGMMGQYGIKRWVRVQDGKTAKRLQGAAKAAPPSRRIAATRSKPAKAHRIRNKPRTAREAPVPLPPVKKQDRLPTVEAEPAPQIVAPPPEPALPVSEPPPTATQESPQEQAIQRAPTGEGRAGRLGRYLGDLWRRIW